MDVMLSSGAVSPRKPLSLRLTVLVLGAVAVVIIFLLWQNGSFKARDTVLISAGFPSQELYMLKHGNLKSVDVQVPGELEDYVKGKGGSAAIVRMDDGAFEVFLLSATPKQLTNDGMRKASLAMSPDGQWIAYATLTNLDVAETEKISSWTMYVLSVASAEATPLVSGYAPQFFMRDGVLTLFFTSPDGYMLADPVAKTTRNTICCRHIG
jgi:hypothetical protein